MPLSRDGRPKPSPKKDPWAVVWVVLQDRDYQVLVPTGSKAAMAAYEGAQLAKASSAIDVGEGGAPPPPRPASLSGGMQADDASSRGGSVVSRASLGLSVLGIRARAVASDSDGDAGSACERIADDGSAVSRSLAGRAASSSSHASAL
eukprot:15484757-Alexandrium_andersonii.AAC.1